MPMNTKEESPRKGRPKPPAKPLPKPLPKSDLVVNIHAVGRPEGSVYIARPSKWGNPFKVGHHGNRLEVIEKYRQYILRRPDLLRDLKELRGKVLACWCRPLACHGDVLAEMANKPVREES